MRAYLLWNVMVNLKLDVGTKSQISRCTSLVQRVVLVNLERLKKKKLEKKKLNKRKAKNVQILQTVVRKQKARKKKTRLLKKVLIQKTVPKMK